MGCLRHALSKRDKKKFIEEIKKEYPQLKLDPKKIIEVGICNEHTVYFYNKTPMFVNIDGKLIPLLRYLLTSRGPYELDLPLVVVDMGAVKHILNGANVMAPGIVRIIGKFDKDRVVIVVDEKYGRPLAICISLYSSDEISKMSKGKVLKNIHYIGDKLWSLSYS